MTVSLPAGLLGNLQAVPQQSLCTSAQLSGGNCPAASQVGATQVNATAVGLITSTYSGNVYLVQPSGSEPVDLGFYVTTGISDPIVMTAPITLRASDAGLNTTLTNIPKQATNVSLLFGASANITINWMTLTLDGTVNGGTAFMVNPTTCASQNATMSVTGWSGGAGNATAAYQATGCAGVPFAPTLTTTLGTPARDTPSGLTVTLTVPSTGNGNAQSAVQNAAITLPPGVVLNAGVASGSITTCTDQQWSPATPTCPAQSQVGTVSFTTPLLPTINGTVYLATQPGAGQFRVFLDLPAPGVHVKLTGLVTPDPTTGQVTTTLSNLPEIPLTSFALSFNGGAQAVFDSPRTCGTLSGSSVLTPWSGGANATPSPTVTVSNDGAGAACPNPSPFAPTLGAQLSSTQAGAATNLTLTITRPDRSAELTSMSVTLPPGLGASIAGITPCSNSNLAANTCGAGPQLGTVSAQVGSGSSEITLNGGIYLAAGTANAPADLAIVLPAVVGPFNLGNVVELAPIAVDPVTGALTPAAPLPTIVGGIPISMRVLTLTFNRASFITNSTSCAAAQFSGSFTSDDARTATSTAAYQPTGCGAVPFAPTVATTLGASTRDTPTGVTVTIGSPGIGQADLRDAVVALPPGLAVNAGVASGSLSACSDAQWGAGSGAAPSCPASSQIGTATLSTPLLPLPTGTVYLGAPTGSNPFRVFVDLPVTANGSHVKLTGLVSLDPASGQVTTTFTDLPQIPFTSFQLVFDGGSNPPVFDTPVTCGTATGSADLTPWSGNSDAVVPTSVTISDPGCPSPLPFAPTLSTSVSDTTAGASPALNVTLARSDGTARPASLALTLPPGLGATLSGIPVCPLAAAQAASCDATSLLGSVTAVVGFDNEKVTLSGDIHLTQGTGGAIAGLAIALPAVVGPFNLGTSVTIANISVGPDGSISQTAALPTIIGGIPVSLRQLSLTLNRPGFITNATSCGAEHFSATVTSADGQTAAPTSPYEATGCAALKFAPAIDATITKDSKGATFETTVTQGAGQANLASAAIALPTSLTVRPSAAGVACPAATYAAGGCAASAQVGTATASSPLLAAALSGPVTLESTPTGFTLGIALGGPISLPLTAAVNLATMTTTLSGIPDLPVSSFVLHLNGGAASMLTTTATACDKPGTLSATFTAHNGATATAKLTPKISPCPPGSAGANGGTTDGIPPGVSLKVKLTRAVAHPQLSATLRDPGIRYVRLTLPGGIALAPHRPGLTVKVNGHVLGPKSMRLTKHSLLLKMGGGVSTITISIRPPALIVPARLTKKKLKFSARTRQTGRGAAYTLTATS
jgi:hypothetical protein